MNSGNVLNPSFHLWSVSGDPSWRIAPSSVASSGFCEQAHHGGTSLNASGNGPPSPAGFVVGQPKAFGRRSGLHCNDVLTCKASSTGPGTLWTAPSCGLISALQVHEVVKQMKRWDDHEVDSVRKFICVPKGRVNPWPLC